MTAPPTTTEEFYVGYLPLPRGHRRFLRIAVPGVLWLLTIVAMSVAWSQRDPGRAVWHDGFEQEWTGTLHARPYPMLVINTGAHAGSIALLVEQGKRGAQARARPHAGLLVRVRGWLLERDGRTIIELAPDADAVMPMIGETPREVMYYSDDAKPVTLQGEIVDAKCFLGAMKPGDGFAHKACATLCIAGGIPPMLVTDRDTGTPDYYLLTSADGGPMPASLMPLIAEPVTIRGRGQILGDLKFVRVSGVEPDR